MVSRNDFVSLCIGLLIVVVALCLFVAVQYARSTQDFPVQRLLCLHSGCPLLDTGDILGVCYPGLHGLSVRGLYGSAWCHVGIAFRPSERTRSQRAMAAYTVVPEEDQQSAVYVLELGVYDRSYRGVMMVPWRKWLHKYNAGSSFAWTQLRGQRPSDEQVLNVFQRNRHVQLQPFNPSWIRLLRKQPYVQPHGASDAPYSSDAGQRRKYICCEFAAHALQELGIVRKRHTPGSYTPRDLVYAHARVPCEASYSYSVPRLLL